MAHQANYILTGQLHSQTSTPGPEISTKQNRTISCWFKQKGSRVGFGVFFLFVGMINQSINQAVFIYHFWSKSSQSSLWNNEGWAIIHSWWAHLCGVFPQTQCCGRLAPRGYLQKLPNLSISTHFAKRNLNLRHVYSEVCAIESNGVYSQGSVPKVEFWNVAESLFCAVIWRVCLSCYRWPTWPLSAHHSLCCGHSLISAHCLLCDVTELNDVTFWLTMSLPAHNSHRES